MAAALHNLNSTLLIPNVKNLSSIKISGVSQPALTTSSNLASNIWLYQLNNFNTKKSNFNSNYVTNVNQALVLTKNKITFTPKRAYHFAMGNVIPKSNSMWWILGAAGLWALYNSVGEVHAKDHAKDHDKDHDTPNANVEVKKDKPAAEKPTTAKSFLPKLISASDVKYAIFSANVITFWDRLLPILISIFSAGLGYWIIYPWFAFYHYKNAAAKLRLPGVDKIEFQGDLIEFWKIYLWNGLATFVTLGFYNFLGYADYNITRYVDHHLKFN